MQETTRNRYVHSFHESTNHSEFSSHSEVSVILNVAIGRLCEKCDGRWCVLFQWLSFVSRFCSFQCDALAPSVTHTSAQKRSCVSVMNAILEHMEGGVSSVVHRVSFFAYCSWMLLTLSILKVSLTRITAQSVRG